jgi:spore coat polysaccharide biosynthesis predicted glycosyltransferase SpsG/CMP-N-acetylneuraminic acid synthetase
MSNVRNNSWIVIPARGGSVEIPRKNLIPIAGFPLIYHVIKSSIDAVGSSHVVVLTDDEEISYYTRQLNCVTLLDLEISDSLDTLDMKILRNIDSILALGANSDSLLLTVQPTSPLISTSSILKAVKHLSENAGSVVSVVNDPHLSWSLDEFNKPTPNYKARLNRQMLPSHFVETGGIIGAKVSDIIEKKTRVVEPVHLIALPDHEGIDIDSFGDYFEAWHLLTRKKILIRVDGAKNLGMGHLYRGLAIANELSRHEIEIQTRVDMPLGAKFFENKPFKHTSLAGEEEFFTKLNSTQPDLLILDVLNVEPELIINVRELVPNIKIISFEDDGIGGLDADVTIFDLISPKLTGYKKALVGSQYALIAPVFEFRVPPKKFSKSVDKIVIFFGGTDPSNLTLFTIRALEKLSFEGEVIVFRGLGATKLNLENSNLNVSVLVDSRSIPEHLDTADLAFTGAGRTIFELASKGVPSICLAQNSKELGHIHANRSHGIIMLGLDVREEQMTKVINYLLNRPSFRKMLHLRALKSMSQRSNRSILSKIFSEIGFEL